MKAWSVVAVPFAVLVAGIALVDSLGAMAVRVLGLVVGPLYVVWLACAKPWELP